MASHNRNLYWIIAGCICSLTALVHLFGGQLDLVNPLLSSNLVNQAKTEWLGVWHLVSIVLLLSAYYLLRYGFNKSASGSKEVVRLIGIMYIFFSGAFILSSLWMQVFAPQWILLLPIGILSLLQSKPMAIK